jgi:hypothetical protein
MDAASHLHPLDFRGQRIGWEPLPCLYVAPTERGSWRVSITPGGYGTEHADKASALVAARRACRRQWERTGEPCLVRLQEEDGTRAVLAGFRDLS